MEDVGKIRLNAERERRLAMSRNVLLVGRASRVADQGILDGITVRIAPRHWSPFVPVV